MPEQEPDQQDTARRPKLEPADVHFAEKIAEADDDEDDERRRCLEQGVNVDFHGRLPPVVRNSPSRIAWHAPLGPPDDVPF